MAVWYLGSLGPHQTPMPAIEPLLPLPLHAPSVYTTRHPSSSSSKGSVGLGSLASAEDVDGAADTEEDAGPSPRTKASASARLENFLNFAPTKPFTCASQSPL